jgi:hypothetical protein
MKCVVGPRVLVWLLGVAGLASAQPNACSSISGSATQDSMNSTSCSTTDEPNTPATALWNLSSTCSVTQCDCYPHQYDSSSAGDGLSGNGTCGTWNPNTMSSIPGAVNCYAGLYSTSSTNAEDVGGNNVWTATEQDQSQSFDAMSCVNGSQSWSSLGCGAVDCESGCANDQCCPNGNSYCSSGCCSNSTCADASSCGGGGGGCLANGYSCSDASECCSNHCDGTCDDVDPIIIDLTGRGYELTSASKGVVFDFYGTTSPIRMSWTAAGWNGGFLALDRNGNGRIDNATEMFSNLTPQPAAPGKTANGFLALAVYDQPANGGNGDGWIDEHDAIYSKLLIWVDKNHNGVTDPGELLTLKQAGVLAISLSYAPSQWTDAFGNVFHYKSQLRTNASADQVVYDVILQRAGRATAPTPATNQ